MDTKQLADAVYASVEGYVARTFSVVSSRIDELSKRVTELASKPAEKGERGERGEKGDPGNVGLQGERGEKGEQGNHGIDGKDGNNGIDGKDGAAGERGEKGDPGIQGKDGMPGERGEKGEPGGVGERGEKGERGLDGEDGADGRDGREGRDGAPGKDALRIEILEGVDLACSYPRATYAHHNGGVIYADRATDPMDGTSLRESGWRVIVQGIAGYEEQQEEEGRLRIVRVRMTDGSVIEQRMQTPMMIHRGVWEDKVYKRGDVVTRGGSEWHCQADETKAVPGTDSTWLLVVKKGRDAKVEFKPNGDAPPPTVRF